MRVLGCFDVDPIRGLLDLAQSYEANFVTKDGSGWFPYNLDDSFVSRGPTYIGINRGDGFT